MAFAPLTPAATIASQLRAVLAANLEQQGALQVAIQVPQDVTVRATPTIDYQKMADEALAALFGVIDANTTGAVKTAVANFRALVGV